MQTRSEGPHRLAAWERTCGPAGLVPLAAATWPQVALTQVQPSDAEARAYTGLRAAAWRGDVAAIEAAAVRKAALEARGGHGRTPLHVGTFAKQREAVKVLLAAGADAAALIAAADRANVAGAGAGARAVLRGDGQDVGGGGREVTAPPPCRSRITARWAAARAVASMRSSTRPSPYPPLRRTFTEH